MSRDGATTTTTAGNHHLITAFLNNLTNHGENPPRFERHGVILPTHRLETWCKSHLTAQYRAVALPQFYTLANALKFLAQSQEISLPLRTIQPPIQELLMQEILDQSHFRCFYPDHAHELLVLHRELTEHEISYDHALDRVSQTIAHLYREERATEVLQTRLNRSLEALIEFDGRLNALGVTTAYGEARQLIEALTKKPFEAPFPWQNLHIVGITSVTPIWLRFLQWLNSWDGTSVWLEQFDDLEARLPATQLLRSLTNHQTHPQTVDCSTVKRSHVLHSAKSQTAEVERALEVIECLRNAGVELHETALLLVEESYAPLIRNALKLYPDLQSNVAIPIPFSELRQGRRLMDLINLLQHNDDYERWGYLILDLMGTELSEHAIDPWISAIRQIGIRPDHKTSEQLAPPPLRPLLRKISALQQKQAQDIEKLRSEVEDIIWGSGEGIPPGPDQTSNDTPMDPRVVRREHEFRQCWDELDQALLHTVPELSSQKYLELLKVHLLANGFRDIGEPLQGLQILSLSEARAYPFKTAIVLGCSDQQLPPPAPQDEIWEDLFKRSIGLYGWIHRQVTEEQTIRSLMARSQQVLFLCSQSLAGDQALPSHLLLRFQYTQELTALKTEAQWQFFLHQAIPSAATASSSVSDPPRGEHPPTLRMGVARYDLRNWLSPISPTALEYLIKCPYRFMMNRLKVQPLSWGPPGEDAQLRGNWLHKILELFFEIPERQRLELPDIPPWPDRELTREEFQAIGLRRLHALTDRTAPLFIRESALTLQLKRYSWPRFIEHIIKVMPELMSAPPRSQYRELPLKRLSPNEELPTIELNGQTLRVTGTIDHLHSAHKILLVSDYKTKSTPEKHEVDRGLAPQLLIYLLVADRYFNARAHFHDLVAGYYSILSGEWLPRIRSNDQIADPYCKRNTSTIATVKENVAKLVSWRLADHQNTMLTVAPDPSRCDFCPYELVCRKSDPTLAEVQKMKPKLEDFLQ